MFYLSARYDRNAVEIKLSVPEVLTRMRDDNGITAFLNLRSNIGSWLNVY